MLGVSGGASYALACIHAIWKERLLGATIVSGLYPVKYGTEGMLLQSRVMLWIAPWMTGLTSILFDNAMGKAARNKDLSVFENLISASIADRHVGDQEAMKDPVNWPIFVAMTRESFAQSSEGASWEANLNGSDWGFELGQLHVGDNGPALSLWHGTEDANCPMAMACKARDLMPGSVLHLHEGHGHVSFIFTEIDMILSDLVRQKEVEG